MCTSRDTTEHQTGDIYTGDEQDDKGDTEDEPQRLRECAPQE